MDKSGDDVSIHEEEKDRLSHLPEPLLCRIMSNLPTRDVVQSCVLSKRWRNLWRYVPGLNVESSDFQDYDTFVSFVYRFLDLNRESCFHGCRLSYQYEIDKAHVTDWMINIVSNRKVKYLEIMDEYSYPRRYHDQFQLPPAVYTCNSLVSLELRRVTLADPELISLPFLKVIKLEFGRFDDGLVMNKLISSCPVLESVCIIRTSVVGLIDHLRVCSKSLMRFEYDGIYDISIGDELEVEIDAPKLEYLKLPDLINVNFRIKNLESLVEAIIDLEFRVNYPWDLNGLPHLNMIRDFLQGISCIKKLSIYRDIVEVIFNYLRCGQPLPIFHNLSFFHLKVNLSDQNLKMLSTFLESCPNLKSLVVQFDDSVEYVDDGARVVSMPKCLLTSLEYVELRGLISGEASEMKLVSYFLENSAILKKLTLILALALCLKKEDSVASDGCEKIEDSVVFRELLNIKRLSTSCEVVIRSL